ncbi:hydantoinase/oxoprolinase family protein [Constrictibacter sp. MBR-5]|jgi:N-methylhydantoinase A|uniref:hydantoinase/oxoprolinase family protein n=1 Tax=Constrictibacter sp. MBR-5 TaxID=3156467 RepID=UPI00339AC308
MGVDVGGTFTDLVLYDAAAGRLSLAKVPSTPGDHSRGVVAAVAASGGALPEVQTFAHGTTVATNAALERKGARLAVITTEGFRDVLILGRGNRLKVYDIKATRPPGMVRRSDVFEVRGRLGPDGEEIEPLDEAGVRAACGAIAAKGYETVAVCFINSYRNPAHEHRAAAICAELLPGMPLCASADVLPEYREYERFSTTALNAAVAPPMSRYLTNLQNALAAQGLARPVAVMTSGGGTWSAERIAALPVHSMLSGPAAGVIAAAHVASLAGLGDIITYDMGGTSSDVAMIRGYRFEVTSEGMVGHFPNRVPQIEIVTVGAGGGSIATVEAGGFLAVGPRSAGAVPGPACYGKGGTEPTVTDANVVLGRLAPADPLGGHIRLDAPAAETMIAEVGATLGLDARAMGEGIIQLAVVRMTAAIKEISVTRGLDPRDFSLLAYGGAGPLHAALVAEELMMPRVVVPPMPGNFSAYGLLVADVRHEVMQTRIMWLDDATPADVEAVLAPLREEAARRVAEDGFAADRTRFELSFDMRYIGQSFDLRAVIEGAEAGPDDIRRAFHAVYAERYVQADDAPVEVVAFRVTAIGMTDKPPLPAMPPGGELRAALLGTRPVVFGGAALPTAIYARAGLFAGAAFDGPAIVEEIGATTLVPPGFRASVDTHGNLLLDRMATHG